MTQVNKLMQQEVTLGGLLVQDPTGTSTAKTTTGSLQPAGPGQPSGVRRHRRLQQGSFDAHLERGSIMKVRADLSGRDPTSITTLCRFNSEV